MYYIIINPVSGFGTINRILDKVRTHLDSLGITGEYAKTISPLDAMHLAKVGMKKGYQRIICVGGDGTVNEVLNGVYGCHVTLGIIPFGRRNLLAKSLGIPLRWQDACTTIANSKEVEIDVGQVGDRYFLSSSGVGLEAEIASQALSAKNQVFTSYLRSLYPVLPDVPPLPLNIMIDETYLVNTRAISASIVNCAFTFQKNFPNLKVNIKGKILKLIIFSYDQKGTLTKDLSSGRNLEQNLSTSYFPARKIQFMTPNDLPIHADGEIIRKTTPIEFIFAPERQTMIVGNPNIVKERRIKTVRSGELGVGS